MIISNKNEEYNWNEIWLREILLQYMKQCYQKNSSYVGKKQIFDKLLIVLLLLMLPFSKATVRVCSTSVLKNFAKPTKKHMYRNVF